ncbi:MAG: XdhC family protein [Myxococcales bacterium]|nr:XdhC family protein [Myxococcales bacterium]USN51489.1 MAG: XdhC family protein [Myxococcales bacterium]
MIFFDLLKELHNLKQASALCTVVAISGSTPRKAGAKMLVLNDGTSFGDIKGSIGGGAIEHHIRKQALEALKENSSRLVTTSLRNELGMCCGGEMTVFIEPIAQKPRFICFGAGHIAQSLCPQALSLDFNVFLLDHRKDLLTLPCFEHVQEKICDSSIFSIENLQICEHDYVVVTSHDHQLDQSIVEAVLKYPTKFLGLVGSKRKALMTQKRLRAKNLDEQQIARLRCPVGLDIYAQTPQEIAFSILAQVIMVKNENTKNYSLNCGSRSQQTNGLSQSSFTL